MPSDSREKGARFVGDNGGASAEEDGLRRRRRLGSMGELNGEGLGKGGLRERKNR